jgi:transcriptional regulator
MLPSQWFETAGEFVYAISTVYTPHHFKESRIDVLCALMREMPLATLIMVDQQGNIDANHVPLQIAPGRDDSQLRLRGHVARANPLWQLAASGRDCLAIFQGAQSYISPRWYASKADHGKVVPTWNYAVVHARGHICAVDDDIWLQAFLQSLTDEHEARVQTGAPWQVSDAPAEYINPLRKAIVGIEIEITSLGGKWKTRQNQPAKNLPTIVAGLQQHAVDTSSSNAKEMADIIAAAGKLFR